MVVARDALAEREGRLARHCREGFQLTQREPAYRMTVLARLCPDLERAPDDLWTAIPWTWTVSLGGELPKTGALAAAVTEAAAVLREWFPGDEPIEELRARWNATPAAQLALGSTLRSHPFADLRAWSIPLLSAG
jgi:hypothetical protein